MTVTPQTYNSIEEGQTGATALTNLNAGLFETFNVVQYDFSQADATGSDSGGYYIEYPHTKNTQKLSATLYDGTYIPQNGIDLRPLSNSIWRLYWSAELTDEFHLLIKYIV
jgi:hypothetical protein